MNRDVTVTAELLAAYVEGMLECSPMTSDPKWHGTIVTTTLDAAGTSEASITVSLCDTNIRQRGKTIPFDQPVYEIRLASVQRATLSETNLLTLKTAEAKIEFIPPFS